MKRVSMIAAKPMRYGTRRLSAGDTFEPTHAEARIFAAVGMAHDAPRQTLVAKEAEAAPAEAPRSAGDLDLDALRAQYQALAGRRPHHMWRADRLRKEIEGLA